MKRKLFSLFMAALCCVSTWATEGALLGRFTINANGDQIVFSKGNLQASTTDLGANWTWAFAEHQWDCIGNAAANNAISGNGTVSANGTVDLFGWSTDATYYGIYGSTYNSEYTGDFVDWGETIGEGWYTLSKDEWVYIFYSRTDANKLFSTGSVNGVNGLIILPDNWSGDKFTDTESGLVDKGTYYFNNNGSNFSYHTYTSVQWSVMEAAGAVFLPAAGNRKGIGMNNVGSGGEYWSATSANPASSYLMGFRNPNYFDGKSYGRSVRLVRSAEGDYLIGSVKDWQDFAAVVQTNPTANARMIADIDLGDDQTMIGTQSVPYEGIFDGQGHTLTVNYNLTIPGIAPFQYVGAATISNLHVDGSIVTSDCGAGGIAGVIFGSLTVSRCWVSATIQTKPDPPYQGTIGGIASCCDNSAVQGKSILIEDCLFSGYVATGVHCGGLMSHVHGSDGYNNSAVFNNCLNIGTCNSPSGSTGTFIRIGVQGDPYTITNCYYKTVWQTAQGSHATDEQLADGTIAAALQANREEEIWVQDGDSPMLKIFASEDPIEQTVWENGVLPGKFSINANGDQIVFSQGNLQYFCSTTAPEWRFAEHQYDYVPFDISAYAENSEKWIDLFAYGTSGYDNGKTSYQPYVVGADWKTYYQSNLTGNADWGYNAISNGGNTENFGWRTPTNNEWLYLFSGRTDAASKYGHGSINGVHGMILLPDDWTTPDGLNFTPGISEWANAYTLEQWSLMEDAGAVFLPASGSCTNTGILSNGTLQNQYGFYRSSAAARYVFFGKGGGLDICTVTYYQYGDAVRLVHAPIEQYSLQQDEEGNYLLGSLQDWQEFAELVKTTPTANAKMIADIDLGDDQTMMGSVAVPYEGIFDGQGHMLTVNYTTTSNFAAPFISVNGATIKNLHTAGTINTSMSYVGGLISDAYGTVTITNCRSSVNIISSKNGDATHGGFVGIVRATITLEGCAFDGSFTRNGGSSSYCGGMIGWVNGSATFNNCFFAPASVTAGMLEACFARGGGYRYFNNTFFIQQYGVAQGKQAYSVTGADGVTVENAATATEYNVSGITSYGTGLKYDGVLYGGYGDNLSLNLGHGAIDPGYTFTGYSASSGTLSGTTNPYTLTMAAANSVVTLKLTIPPTEIEEIACDSFPWHGTMYYATEDITKTFQAVNGCDSVVTLHLIVNHSSFGEESQTAEGSYEWIDGKTYTESGDYTYTLTNVAGCDSVVTLHLTITQTPPPTVWENGVLPGKFSINANGDQVFFSQGNLQYQATTDTWRFAICQSDYIGANNTYISETYDDWVDLLQWGAGDNPTTIVTYTYNTFVEFGSHAISNGGNTPDAWRTLTKDEWVYIFRDRTNAESLFGLGSVNGVNGLIILPDNWTTPDGLTINPSTEHGLTWLSDGYYRSNTADGYSHNVYTSEQWTTMESNGAVFLPSAGVRYLGSRNIGLIGTEGYYWSSTKTGSTHANIMTFSANILNPQHNGMQDYGHSIRLVQAAPADPGPATGMDELTGYGLPVTGKVLRDGQLLILRGDKTYTLTGQEVK